MNSHRSLIAHALCFSAFAVATACAPVTTTTIEEEELVSGEESSRTDGEDNAPDDDAELETAIVTTPAGDVVEVAFGKVDGHDVTEGDIVLPPATRQGVAANTRESRPWPGGVVPYTVAANLPDPQRVADAIAHWEARTAIRFVKRTDETAYVSFMAGQGCYSSIGRTGQKQDISLAKACSTGSAIHEIGHAMGLWHEQSRADRDSHVKVHLENVTKGHEHNFRKMTGASLGTYDLGSIMHYGSTAFSANGKPTLTTIDGKTITPNRSALSIGDLAGVKALYGGAAAKPPAAGPVPAPTPAASTTTTLVNLNLRSGPGLDFTVLATMPAGSTVTRTGASQNGFDAVTYEGKRGWAYARNLAE